MAAPTRPPRNSRAPRPGTELAAREFAEHLGIDEGLGKGRVRPRFEIKLRARDCPIHAFGRRGIGARDDVKMAARLDGGASTPIEVVARSVAFFNPQLVLILIALLAALLAAEVPELDPTVPDIQFFLAETAPTA